MCATNSSPRTCLRDDFSALFLVRLCVCLKLPLGWYAGFCMFVSLNFTYLIFQHGQNNIKRSQWESPRMPSGTAIKFTHTHARAHACAGTRHYHITFCTNSEHPICYVSVESFTPFDADHAKSLSSKLLSPAAGIAFRLDLFVLVSSSVLLSSLMDERMLHVCEYIIESENVLQFMQI